MKTVTVTSGNLFEVAAAAYGNALQWINIARTNRIRDPFISGLTKIVISPPSSEFSNGIGPQ